MTKAINRSDGYNTIAEAMEAEGLYQIRHYAKAPRFSVQTHDGRIGQGATIRDAIDNASHIEVAA